MKITDKQRLDWLTKNEADLALFDSGWTTVIGTGEYPRDRHSSPRKAIDFAMKAKPNSGAQRKPRS